MLRRMRVLGRIRLSRLTEESTSAARQREFIEQWAVSNGHEVIGWAEDLDVSGSIDPFDTPALGEWLNERPDQFDCLAAWKLDRLGRNSIRLNKLFGWAIDNGKTIVSCTEGIDLSTPVGRLIANVIAFLAEGELEAIRERTRASRRKLLESGRWPGGTVPFGFTPQPVEGGGWILGHNPEEVAVIRLAVDQICNGASVAAVAQEHGMLPQTVWNMLTSKTLLGHATYEGKTVRDRHGQPVLNAEPLLSQDEWDRLQKALSSRRQLQTRTAGVSAMNGIAFCPVCDSQLYFRRYKSKGKYKYCYYYCPNGHGRNIPAEKVEKLVFDAFLEDFGGDPVLEKVYVPAEDHQIELEAAESAYKELTALVGTTTSERARSLLYEQLRALDFELERLEKIPSREAGWEQRETGSTFNDVWLNAAPDAKRKMIIDKGITAHIIKDGTEVEFYIETQKSPPTQ